MEENGNNNDNGDGGDLTTQQKIPLPPRHSKSKFFLRGQN